MEEEINLLSGLVISSQVSQIRLSIRSAAVVKFTFKHADDAMLLQRGDLVSLVLFKDSTSELQLSWASPRSLRPAPLPAQVIAPPVLDMGRLESARTAKVQYHKHWHMLARSRGIDALIVRLLCNGNQHLVSQSCRVTQRSEELLQIWDGVKLTVTDM